MARPDYRRPRGRAGLPSTDEQREARNRRFPVDIDRPEAPEQKEGAAFVCMDQSFVHRAHSSAYS